MTIEQADEGVVLWELRHKLPRNWTKSDLETAYSVLETAKEIGYHTIADEIEGEICQDTSHLWT